MDAQGSPYPPELRTVIYLYDEADPQVDLAPGANPHVTVRIDCGESTLRIVGWTPATLHRLAAALIEASSALGKAIAEAEAARIIATHAAAEQLENDEPQAVGL